MTTITNGNGRTTLKTGGIIAAVLLALSMMGISAGSWLAINREISAMGPVVVETKRVTDSNVSRITENEKAAAAHAQAFKSFDDTLASIDKRLERIEDRLVR